MNKQHITIQLLDCCYKKSLLFILMLAGLCAQAQEFISLWPADKMPNTKGMNLKDSIVNERIYQVGTPGMCAFFPSKDDNNGTAIIIFPGGGYTHLTYNLGGFQLAKWFNSLGMSAFVVNYRMPNSPDLVHRETGPLQDAQRAIKIVRANAGKWKINTDKIGVQGSSAGGHLAALAGTSIADISAIKDDLDTVSVHPDFMILVSPVIDLGKYAHIGSRKAMLGDAPSQQMVDNYSVQNNVTVNTSPCFIADAFNDKTVPPQNSLLFYQALLDKNVSTSFHVFPQGGHAINVNNNPGSTGLWKSLCESWLKEMEFITPSIFK
ncbi:alpha/beta hydrolase [soil metagenome]